MRLIGVEIIRSMKPRPKVEPRTLQYARIGCVSFAKIITTESEVLWRCRSAHPEHSMFDLDFPHGRFGSLDEFINTISAERRVNYLMNLEDSDVS